MGCYLRQKIGCRCSGGYFSKLPTSRGSFWVRVSGALLQMAEDFFWGTKGDDY